MIISYDFGIDLKDYAARGKKNDFPVFDYCPNCKCLAHGNLHRNGYYWRFGITEEATIRIPVCRLKCLVCDKSISVLPDFLIPYFQHTIHTVLNRLSLLIQKKKVNGYRQLWRFHLLRYWRNLNWIHSFFTDCGSVFGVVEDIEKRATKYMKMILDFGESPFLRRSWGHLSKYFMAY